MRCISCNENLNDFESTRKSARTGEYIDLCNKCIAPIINEFELIEREDLRSSQAVSEEELIAIGEEDDTVL